MTGSYSDFHSHLFPGVDDGSRHLRDSLEGIGRMVENGVERIITTPHLRASLTRDPEQFAVAMSVMDEAWGAVWKAAKEAHPQLDFRRGHEVMLDVPDPDLSDRRLHLGGTHFILVEWPRLHIPPGTVEVLGRLKASGLTPVVAHPERYVGVDKGLEILRAWRDVGACLQGNYGSLVGRYGPTARMLIMQMLEEGLLDYLASDFHGRPEYTLYIQNGRDELERLGGDQQLEVLGKTNPARLFRGEPPFPVPPLKVERTLLQRMKEWVRG